MDRSSQAAARRWFVVRLVLVGVLPATLLGVGVAKFILNHFFAHAPYLLDSGWYSDIVYRAGLWPKNPRIACDYAEYYYGVHPSPYISAWSALSYIVPIHRIEWYAIFEAFVFIPFGFAVYALSSGIDRATAIRRLPLTFVAAFAFTFNGQVLRMVPYPHYEGAIAAFGCLWLATIVTGRTRWAWVFLLLAASVREDAGLHMALAITPLIYLHWRGVEMPVQRRSLFMMFGAAIATSVVLIFCQKVLAHGPSILKIVYLGDPIYSHITRDVLVERAHRFLDACQLIYYPLIATCIVAAVRRDPRYLLGWVPGIPWFLLNFFASQPQKATLEAYAHFPYIICMFWAFAYGAALAPSTRRLRAGVLEAVIAIVCLSSTIGLYRAGSYYVKLMYKDMRKLQPFNRDQIHGFVDALATRRTDFGRLYVDYSVAAIALESVNAKNGWTPSVGEMDTVAFHDASVVREELLPTMFANGLDVCTRITRTHVLVCTHDRLPAQTFAGLQTDTIPSAFAIANSLRRRGVRVTDRGVSIASGTGVDGVMGRLGKGRYEMTWTLEDENPHPADKMLEVTIYSDVQPRASSVAPTGAKTISVQFDASGDESLWFRSGVMAPSGVTITHTQIRRIDAPAI